MRTRLSMLKPYVLARQQSCRQEVSGEVLGEQFAVYQELDDSSAEDFDHRRTSKG